MSRAFMCPPKSKAATKARVTASKAGNNAHPAQSAADRSAAHAADEAKDQSAGKPEPAP
jgi:hypothetical protein